MSVPTHTQHPHTAHATGVADSGRWSTRRIAAYALFTALAIVAGFIELPLFPAAPYLKYDPSGVVALVAGFAYGPHAAAVVSILGFLPHLFTNPWGALMAIAVALALSVPAAAIHRIKPTPAGAALGILAGSSLALAAAIGGNLLVTPLYAHMTIAQVVALIVPVLLPFNLIKLALHALLALLTRRPILNLLKR